MSRRRMLGLDLGGGGVRCLLADGESGECFSASKSWHFPVAEGTFGLGFDFEPDSAWARIGDACREVLQSSGTEPADVVSVAVSAVRFGNVLLDRDGEVLFAVPNRDARAAGECFQLMAEHGEEMLAASGLWPMPIHASARLLWLQKQHPDILEHADCLLGLSEWVNNRLCGARVQDASQAGCTGLFGLESREWNWNLIDALGLSREIFPKVAETGSEIGFLCATAAQDLGLAEGIPIGLGGGDTQCGLLGAGTIQPTDAACVAGTTVPLQIVGDRPRIDSEGRLWSGHHVVANRWVLESNGGPMGETLTWMARLLFPDVVECEARLLEEAATSDIGSKGMLSTLGAEVMNARAPSMPVGQFTLTHMTCQDDPNPRCHLARALIEGYACAIRANLEQLTAIVNHDVTTLDLVGGLSRSDFFAEILADILQIPVRLPVVAEATGLGAALCGGVAAGEYPDWETAIASLVSHRSIVEPSPARADASSELFESWSRVRDAGAESTAPAIAGHAAGWVLKPGS